MIRTSSATFYTKHKLTTKNLFKLAIVKMFYFLITVYYFLFSITTVRLFNRTSYLRNGKIEKINLKEVNDKNVKEQYQM